MPDETIIADCHQFTDESMGLYFAPFADRHVFLYLHKGTDKGLVADSAAVQIARFNDRYLFAKLDIADTNLFYNGLIHNFLKKKKRQVFGKKIGDTLDAVHTP
jgi:hypothetical protein